MISKYKLLFTFTLIAFLLLVNNHSIPLWDQDESAYAGFGYEMKTTGNWLVPDFMYSDVHRKPPLHFWNITLSYYLFGYNEFAVRFSSFLAILGTFLLLYFQGRKFVAEPVAYQSLWVLAGSFLVTSLAKVAVTDATVLFFSTLCAFAALNVLKSPSKHWIFIYWLGIAFGALTKGPPVIAFTGIFTVLLMIFHKNRWNLLKLHPWFFMPIALLPAVVWGYLTYLNDGGIFLQWMYEWYILKRIDGQVFGQTGPIGTHLLGIMAFFALFIRFIPLAIFNGVKGAIQKNESYLLVVLWWVAGWFFYEFSPSKLPAYVIAAHIPFALLIAFEMQKLKERNIFKNVLAIFHYLIFGGLGLLLLFIHQWVEIPSQLNLVRYVFATFLIIYTVVLVIQKNRQNEAKYYQYGAFLFVILAWIFMPTISNLLNSSKQIAEVLPTANTENQKKVYIAYNFGRQPSLPYYLKLKGYDVQDATRLYKSELKKLTDEAPQSIFLMNQEQYEYILIESNRKWSVQNISTLMIDRRGATNYYLIQSE